MDLHNYECFSRYTFVSDETHKNLTWLDHRIWRGNILEPYRSYDGHITWSEVLNQHIGISGDIEVNISWANKGREVYCTGNNHYSNNHAGLSAPLWVELQRVPYRGDYNDRGVWTCKYRLGGEDVITILRTVGSGERFEFWGPSGYVSELGLARERIIRLAHPYLPSQRPSLKPAMAPKARDLPINAVAKAYLEERSNTTTPVTIGGVSARLPATLPSYLTPIVPVAPMQRESMVIDLCDSSSDDEDEDLPAASRSSPLSSAATFEDTDLTIPDLATDGDDSANNENEPGATALVKRTLTSCPYCDFEGRTYKPLYVVYDIARHMEAAEKLRAEGKMPQSCSVCSKSFCTTSALAKHQCTTSNVTSSLQCRYCSYQATKVCDLERHEATAEQLQATGTVPERCEICGNSYCTGRAFAFHVCDAEEVIVSSGGDHAGSPAVSEHGAKDWNADELERDTAGYYHCSNCDYRSTERANVERHLDRGEKAHREGDPRQECIACRQTFCTKGAIQRHHCGSLEVSRRSRRSEVSLAARKTGMEPSLGTISETSEYGEDMLERDGMGNYCCMYCDYNSPWAGHVRRHLDWVTKTGRVGQRGVQCTDCDKVFCTAQTLSRHDCGGGTVAAISHNASSAVKTTSKEANSPFKRDSSGYHCCPNCDYKGRWVGNVERHMDWAAKARSNGQMSVHCQACRKCFCTPSALSWHQCQSTSGLDTKTVDLGLTNKKGEGGDNDAAHVCPDCDYVALQLTTVRRHMEAAERARLAGQATATCNDCGQRYCTQTALQYHDCGPGTGMKVSRMIEVEEEDEESEMEEPTI